MIKDSEIFPSKKIIGMRKTRELGLPIELEQNHYHSKPIQVDFEEKKNRVEFLRHEVSYFKSTNSSFISFRKSLLKCHLFFVLLM